MARVAASRADVIRGIESGKLCVGFDGACYFRRRRSPTLHRCKEELVRGPHQREAYARVCFTVETGENYRVLVHRAVWWAAGNDIPEGMEINHKNGSKLDNRLENLELTTSSGNKKHAFASGLNVPARGARSGPAQRARLTPKDVRTIRDSDDPQADLSKRFGVAQSEISRIRNRKRYAWVD